MSSSQSAQQRLHHIEPDIRRLGDQGSLIEVGSEDGFAETGRAADLSVVVLQNSKIMISNAISIMVNITFTTV